MVKNLSANAGDLRGVGSTPGLEDPLEEGMATHSNILAWRTHGPKRRVRCRGFPSAHSHGMLVVE